MAAKKNRKSNFYKIIYQFGILFILAFMAVRLVFDKFYTPDFEAYCPFGGLQALGSYLTWDSLACTMTGTQIIMGILLAAGAMLFGKLFCAFICPVGTVSELIGRLGERMGIRITIKGLADNILRSLKYILLFITFYFTITSSELFCKTFDPYYALASGFNSDVVILYAVLTLMVLFVGSLFVRLLWCKYLCPLGAITNIFRFFWFFLAVSGIYFILIASGLSISWIWLLGIVSVGGYILEIWQKSRVFLSPVNITRNTESCINCNICNKKCPQGIDVAHMVTVNHIDCNLCGDCVTHCPEKNTLLINRRFSNWLPAAVLAVLLIIGFSLKSVWEIPTIDEKWGTKEQMESAVVFTKEGLKNIKCFGSSKAFSSKMKHVEGVYGVSTFVKNNSVKILYNPQVLSDSMLLEIIFAPVQKIIRPFNAGSGPVIKVNMGVENFFDPYDAYYLQQLLLKYTTAVALQTDYSCPVSVSVYFPADSLPDPPKLKELIEMKNLNFYETGTEFNININYEVKSMVISDTLSAISLLKEMYIRSGTKYSNYSDYSAEQRSWLTLHMGENEKFRDELTYLISHLSGEDGILSFSTRLDDNGTEWVELSYIDSLISGERILKLMNTDSLYFIYRDGTEGVINNPFIFVPEK